MAIEEGVAVPSQPYRENARRPALRAGRSRILRSPLLRVLIAPSFIATALVMVPGLALGLLNLTARDHESFVVGEVARLEDAIAWAFVGTVPVLALALAWTSRKFSGPRALKRRYVRRALVRHAVVVALAFGLASSLRPSTPPLLTSATRADGRRAFVYRFPWGCSYDLRAEDRHGLAELVTVVGPFPCNGPVPRVVWERNDLTIVAADGETIGTWPANR